MAKYTPKKEQQTVDYNAMLNAAANGNSNVSPSSNGQQIGNYVPGKTQQQITQQQLQNAQANASGNYNWNPNGPVSGSSGSDPYVPGKTQAQADYQQLMNAQTGNFSGFNWNSNGQNLSGNSNSNGVTNPELYVPDKPTGTLNSEAISGQQYQQNPNGGQNGQGGQSGQSSFNFNVQNPNYTPTKVDANYNPYTDAQFNEALNGYANAIASGYDRQREESDATYAKAKSEADRSALKRGMQRSSYNNQVMAGIDVAAAKARQNISDAEQADVDKYASQIASELRQQNQWAQTQNMQNEQFGQNLNLQYQQLGEQNAYHQGSLANEAQSIANTAAYQQGSLANEAQSIANTAAYQQGSLANQAQANQWSHEDTQAANANQNAYWQGSLQNQSNSLASSDAQYAQSIAWQQIQQLAANGGKPSAALLAAAGLTQAEYNSLKKKPVSSSSNPGNTPPPSNNPGAQYGLSQNDYNLLMQYGIDPSKHSINEINAWLQMYNASSSGAGAGGTSYNMTK